MEDMKPKRRKSMYADEEDTEGADTGSTEKGMEESSNATGSKGSYPSTNNSSDKSDQTERRISLLGDEIPDEPESNMAESEIDEGDSDPELVAKRHQAKMKNALAAGAEAAIKKAESKLARNTEKDRLQCTTVYIIAMLLSLAGAIHTSYLNHGLGPPPTVDAATAASSLVPVLLLNALLAMSAFVILYLKISSLLVGFTWMTLLVFMEYAISIIVSKSAVTVHIATFDDILSYSKEHYQVYQNIPEYVDYYQTTGDCCGWGDPNRKFAAWPELLKTNDLPDSCCRKRFYGCGKGAVARGVPSGHIMALSANEYARLLQFDSDRFDSNYLMDTANVLSKVFKMFPPSKGIPEVLLRLLDEIHDTPMYYLLADELVNEDKEELESVEVVTYIYKSYGQAENYRLWETIKDDTCDTSIILWATKLHSVYILVYSSIQLLLCFLMAIVFWYYFVEARAEIMSKNKQPGEFFLLQMENINIDDRYNKVLTERKRMDRIQDVRKKEQEDKLAHDKLLAEMQARLHEHELERMKANNEKSTAVIKPQAGAKTKVPAGTAAVTAGAKAPAGTEAVTAGAKAPAGTEAVTAGAKAPAGTRAKVKPV